jgi:ABC-2 type transport system ATP-binding protein
MGKSHSACRTIVQIETKTLIMSTEVAIDATALAKQYSTDNGETVDAVRGIDLAIKNGEIYALLGPNGAGKTTTISMLTTLLIPSSGSASVAGFDVVKESANVRRRIGVTFQEIVLDEDLTGQQVLDFHGKLYGISRQDRADRITELADMVELSDVLDRKVSSYSGGMKRRLELARGLMTWPQVLFLDEPTQGLDPHNRAGIWRYIRRLSEEMGITLLLTTHYMDEAEALADRVGIIDHGRLIVEGTPASLIRQMGADVVSILGHGEADAFVEAANGLDYVSKTTLHEQAETVIEGLDVEDEASENPEGDGKGETTEQDSSDSDRDLEATDIIEYVIQVGVDAGDRRLVELVQLAGAEGFHVSEISVSKPSLADVFLAYTGHELRDS